MLLAAIAFGGGKSKRLRQLKIEQKSIGEPFPVKNILVA